MSYSSVLSSNNAKESGNSSPGSPSTKGSSLHQSLYGSASWTAEPPPAPNDSTPSIYPPAKAPAASSGGAIPIPQLTSVVSGGGETPTAQDSSFNYGGFDPSATATSAFQTTEDQRKKSIEAFLSQSPSQALGDAFVGMGLEEDGGKSSSATDIDTDNWAGDSVQASAAEYVPSQFQYDDNSGYDAYGNGGINNGYGVPQVGGSFQPQVVNAAQPQGVFYMAVNVGGQQVLQPVQLVQLPNGQMATVLANPPAMQDGGIGGLGMGYDPSFGAEFDNGTGRRKKGQRTDDILKRDISPIDTPADLAIDNQNSDLHELYGSTRRPALKDLLGNVCRLSKDQVGCRLLQQALDEDGSEAATAIFKEGLAFMSEIMVDPFGNYLFQKILEKCSDAERLTIIRTVAPKLVQSALNLHGTRSVQKVVEMCSFDANAATAVTKSLAPQAARLCIDANGNHVIQRVLQRLPHQHARFVFDAVAASVGEVARHRHGCCVIQRCLDSPKSTARSNLVAKIVEKALELMQDAYGNYVVQYVLDVCSDEEAHAVCQSVAGRVTMLAIQKFSSNVMEKCLEKANDKTQELYMREISHPEKVKDLMSDPFGNYVVQRALAVATHAQAVRLVEAMRPHLSGMRNTAGGRRIVAKICRRFPNFNSELQPSSKEHNNFHHNNYHHKGGYHNNHHSRDPYHTGGGGGGHHNNYRNNRGGYHNNHHNNGDYNSHGDHHRGGRGGGGRGGGDSGLVVMRRKQEGQEPNTFATNQATEDGDAGTSAKTPGDDARDDAGNGDAN
eukprot:CAMPEP_0118671846 /NCGR_PEP_ID=MMETSP0785-20121206/22221_1 /TAXON_ID=91992 /ORGANISM="Bolidomonas pacifica, Strain CCMP 1866" /LENGTH=781 /DNA_ID=CAMNT_0006566761 /DNA_START=163 /DNA_END=2509 /DNA_ORIENTATION=-